MNITFKSENGSCPKFIHNGTIFYLLEEKDSFGEMSWVLKSKKIGFIEKTPKKVCTYSLLKRFFKNKTYGVYNKPAYKVIQKGDYTFYYWHGKQIATDGRVITIQYESKYERPYFNSYAECLANAKEYISKTYMNEQLNLFTT